MEKTCRFCGKDTLRVLFAANKGSGKETKNFACTNSEFGRHGEIVVCDSCHVVYVSEKIAQEKITTHYEIVEDPVYFKEQEARSKTFQGYLKKLEKVFPKKGKLLDVGTFTGLFVKIARDNKWDASGIEPNKWGVEYAKKNYGINLINKPFEKDVFPKDTFDVVTMWDVIEHFENPDKEAEKVFKILKTGGVFAFSTVDPDALSAKMTGTKWPWYMDMHRVFWSRKAAIGELKKIGFKKVIFKAHWRYFSLGYLATRTAALHPSVAKSLGSVIKSLGLEKTIVPYYANDLYDCYAFK